MTKTQEIRPKNKFQMYDNVWCIVNDKVVNGWICEITAPCNQNQECTYNVSRYTANGDKQFFNKNKVLLSDEIFRTKEELIQSLI